MNFFRVTIGFVMVLLFCCLFLLLSGKRVLVAEDRVRPGEDYVIQGYGNVGEGKADSLVCGYFTGRGVVQKVYWHSPNNIMGKDECPFILDAGE